jgi:hypothetical protein
MTINRYWQDHNWSWRERMDGSEHSDAYPVVFQCDNCHKKFDAWAKKGVTTTGLAVGVICKNCQCPTLSARGVEP